MAVISEAHLTWKLLDLTFSEDISEPFYLGAAALYFRYRRTPEGLAPGKLWDACLWASCVGFLVVSLKVLADKLPLLWG